MTSSHHFTPLPAQNSDVVTWIHIGDLHMVRPGEQNFQDLQSIVTEINQAFAGKSASFVYLPGDVADDGSETAYSAVRTCIDHLDLPWCAVVGDHDVREKSFRNFKTFMDAALYSAFTVGLVRFFRLNCFSDPVPDSFSVDHEQLAWLEHELERSADFQCVLLMHCYPSDLKRGGAELTRLIHRYGVVLVDMGHTHYNEISNDGQTLFTATRSTGQIEEGSAGYSIVTVDGRDVSWHFKTLGTLPLVSITTPVDDRLRLDAASNIPDGHALPIRVCVWGAKEPQRVDLEIGGKIFSLENREPGTWAVTLPGALLPEGSHTLTATAYDGDAACGSDQIKVTAGSNGRPTRRRDEVDHENAVAAWTERGLLGTQMGPNKNGRKW